MDLKVLLKIKVFMWFLHKKAIIIKNNLAKRKGGGKTNIVLSATRKRQSNIFYLSVILLKLFGDTCFLFLISSTP